MTVQNGKADGRLMVVNINGNRLVVHETIYRQALIDLLQGKATRDIDELCGYPRTLGIHDYQSAYERNGIAARVVRVFPKESWAMSPDVYETEDLAMETPFEIAWEDLKTRFNLYSKMLDADVISGIGRFGILLFGLNDGKPLSEAVDGMDDYGNRTSDKKYDLLYLRAFSEASCTIGDLESNPSSPRFGHPVNYKIKLATDTEMLPLTSGFDREPTVHWTRVIHLCDNRESSEVFGIPRCQQVYNDIFNIRKILGGDGEGFWKGGFPGISYETHPSIENPELDIEDTKAELQKYMEGFQRFLIGDGMTARSLVTQVADPKSHFETQLQALTIAMEIPVRVFMGTEEGRLASGQDMRVWKSRVMSRQHLYIDPYILRPVANRLIAYGVLPRPEKMIIVWPDLNAPTENDRATTAQKITEALVKYVAGGVQLIMPPKEYLTIVMGFPLAQVESILTAAGNNFDKLDDIAMAMADAGGDSNQPGKDEGAGRE